MFFCLFIYIEYARSTFHKLESRSDYVQREYKDNLLYENLASLTMLLIVIFFDLNCYIVESVRQSFGLLNVIFTPYPYALPSENTRVNLHSL